MFNKFILLMWKNWVLCKRRPVSTAFEIILPGIICLLLVFIRSIVPAKKMPEITFLPFRTDNINSLCYFGTTIHTIAVTPRSTMVDLVVKRIVENCPRVKFKHYKNVQELNKAIGTNNFYAAIQFEDSLSNVTKNTNLPPTLTVTIRMASEGDEGIYDWNTNLLYVPVVVFSQPRDLTDTSIEPYYHYQGFLLLQQLITMALINENKTKEKDIVMRRYPYSSYLDDLFFIIADSLLLSLVVMLSFMLSFVNTIRGVTTEKEQQLKESMKVMGLPGWLHWLTWFLRTFILFILAIIVIVILLKTKIGRLPVFVYTDAVVLTIFLLLFASSTITFAFLISVFFSKANIAVIIGSLVFFLTYLPYLYITLLYYKSTSLAGKLGSCLLTNSALSFGLFLIIHFEVLREGVLWTNLWTPVSPDDDLTFGSIMLMLLLDTFLYFIMALYIEAIFPGEFGVPKPWYFPVSRAYWSNKFSDETTEARNQGEFFEESTENLPKEIQLKNLSKKFGTHTVVKNLSLDMYEGHITVLLGHNGAGKTTTMSMITGMFPPTSGTAIVNGYDVRRNIGKVRDSMGLCLQHNVLYDNLTVKEHLYFFGKLKGLKGNEINGEINNYLKLLELEDKRDAFSKTLSGGMKRKLSVAIALCGKSKIVMLDEPTSGMDPSARRTIWNLLQKQKQGRTILLTTHFMDEADLLGDRIAIMSAGDLKCCGSSFFLKKKYSAGYYLIMDISPTCVPQSVTTLLRMYIPQISIYSQAGTELTYRLSESDSPKFERMLRDLESNSAALGVLGYGISLNTLHEVFLKVGTEKDNRISETQHNRTTNKGNVAVVVEERNKPDYLTGRYLTYNQFYAMFLKKIMSTIRTWHLFLLQIAIPVLLLLILLVYQNKSGYPPLKITLNTYQNPITLLSGNKKDPLYVNYKSMLTGRGKVSEVTNITKTIITLMADDPLIVRNRYIVGASFEDEKVIAWFNGEPYHSAPLSLGLVLNALYKHHLGKEKSITFINHPLPFSLKTQFNAVQSGSEGTSLLGPLGYGIIFVISFYILFYIKERVIKCKHLQYVSGMKVRVFWMAAFLSDLITYIIIITVLIIEIAAMQKEGLRTPEELGVLALVLIYSAFFLLPFVYLAAYCFSIPSSGFSKLILLGIITGVIGVAIVELFNLFQFRVGYTLNWILIFIPFYTFCKSINDLNTVYLNIKLCTKHSNREELCAYGYEQCCGIPDYFSADWPGIGGNMFISFLMCFLLFTILIRDFGCCKSVINILPKRKKLPVQVADLDDDVQKENEKIKNTSEADLNKQYCLVLRDVTKYYKKLLAVNGLCLGVKPSECFGLLGVNGAGKTTTFKMMTGDESFSFGDAWVNGFNIKSQLKEVQKYIGYCPQSDALLDDLTVRETLKIFALIRGIPHKRCKEMGEELAREFDFDKHMDKKIKQLSGGNKRKVSTALALIGDPPVIFLDEPSTGMDPASKRHLWTTLSKLRNEGKCIILTSHSMEECEALCTRLAIMVNGHFQCLGSVQHLKNKFAQDYSLTVKLKKRGKSLLDADVAAMDNFVNRYFPGAVVKEKYQQLVTYQLPMGTMPWSQIFGILERNKNQLNIEDYSIGQCSLEQVFLSFTRYQR